MGILYAYQQKKLGKITAVFDVEKDPEERENLCESNHSLCNRMVGLLVEQRKKRQKDIVPQKYWIKDSENGGNLIVQGDCKAAEISKLPTYKRYDYDKYTNCSFVHPWKKLDI